MHVFYVILRIDSSWFDGVGSRRRHTTEYVLCRHQHRHRRRRITFLFFFFDM